MNYLALLLCGLALIGNLGLWGMDNNKNGKNDNIFSYFPTNEKFFAPFEKRVKENGNLSVEGFLRNRLNTPYSVTSDIGIENKKLDELYSKQIITLDECNLLKGWLKKYFEQKMLDDFSAFFEQPSPEEKKVEKSTLSLKRKEIEKQ